MAAGDMSHAELSTLAAGTGDYKLLAECVAVSALALVHEMQNAPASLPAKAAAFIQALTARPTGALPELTPSEGGQ